MATVSDLIDTLKNFNLNATITACIEQTKDDYIELNTQQQLFKGLDATGNEMAPLYKSPYYAKKKNQMNPIPGLGVPDLKVTGSFYQKMNIEVESDSFKISSDVDYAQYLEKNYEDEKIYGLTEENQEEYNQGPFFNALEQKITEETGLKFK